MVQWTGWEFLAWNDRTCSHEPLEQRSIEHATPKVSVVVFLATLCCQMLRNKGVCCNESYVEQQHYYVPWVSIKKYNRKMNVTLSLLNGVHCAWNMFQRKAARCSGVIFTGNTQLQTEKGSLAWQSHCLETVKSACGRTCHLQQYHAAKLIILFYSL